MSEKKQKKYTKIGAVLKGQYGPFIVMGNDRANKPEYKYEVQIMVRDAQGNQVVLVKNPMVKLQDPRSFVREDGTSPNVPDKIMYDLTLVTDVEPQ